MAVWSKALLLTVEKVARDLGLGGGFRPGTPVSSTSYNWLLTT